MDLQSLNNLLGKIRTFGPFIPLSNQFLLLGGKYLPESFADGIFRKRYDKINRILKEIVGEIEQTSHQETVNDGPVWVCWLQGEDQMPLIPRLCLDKLRKNVIDKPIHVITLKNMHNYIDLGGKVMDMYGKGRIANFHLSDLIRMRLLSQYGGFWADATLLVTAPLSRQIFELPFFSIKTLPRGRNISNCRWTTFCMASAKGNIVTTSVDKILQRYWQTQDWHIDYFLLDTAINYAYETVSQVKAEIDAVPYNNPQLYAMNGMLCEPYDPRKFEQVTADTSIFKLNWRAGNDPRLLAPDSVFSHLKNL